MNATATTVDIAPLIHNVAVLLVPIILSVFGAWLQKNMKDKDAAKALLTGAENAAAWGLARTPGAVPGKPLTIDLGSTALVHGLQYMRDDLGDAAKRFGYDDRKLLKLVTAKMPGITEELDEATINGIIATAGGKPPAADPGALVRALLELAQSDPVGLNKSIEALKAAKAPAAAP